MDYSNFTKEELIDRISELEILNYELIKEREQETMLEYAWSGNLGHWYWNITLNTVTFNELKVTTLGYEKNEIPEHVTYQFFTDKLHPDDYQKTMDAMRNHIYGKSNIYEVEYRIKAKDGTYKWYYDRGKITKFDENGKPLFLAGIVFDVTEKKELQIELETKNRFLLEISSIDGLTKINNHRTIIDHLTLAVSNAREFKTPLTVGFFDIDDFKKANDSNGHLFGDHILVQIAEIIKRNVRESDFVGRYGGEEFMVIFPNTNLNSTVVVCERIRHLIETHQFGNDTRITISCGLREYCGESLVELINYADKNLYEAKMKGKNQVIY